MLLLNPKPGVYFLQASIALYVPSDVSGENRLLLATTGSPPVAV